MKKVILISVPILIVILAVVGVFLFSNSKAGTKQASTSTFDPDLFNWQQNGKGGAYIVQMKSEKVSSPIKAKVLIDANCDPDRQGLSHCNVTVKQQDGKQIQFVMTHNMMNYPCLNLKSTIEISPYAEGWAKVKEV